MQVFLFLSVCLFLFFHPFVFVIYLFLSLVHRDSQVYLRDLLHQQGIDALALVRPSFGLSSPMKVGELRETMDILSRFGCPGEPRVWSPEFPRAKPVSSSAPAFL